MAAASTSLQDPFQDFIQQMVELQLERKPDEWDWKEFRSPIVSLWTIPYELRDVLEIVPDEIFLQFTQWTEASCDIPKPSRHCQPGAYQHPHTKENSLIFYAKINDVRVSVTTDGVFLDTAIIYASPGCTIISSWCDAPSLYRTLHKRGFCASSLPPEGIKKEDIPQCIDKEIPLSRLLTEIFEVKFVGQKVDWADSRQVQLVKTLVEKYQKKYASLYEKIKPNGTYAVELIKACQSIREKREHDLRVYQHLTPFIQDYQKLADQTAKQEKEKERMELKSQKDELEKQIVALRMAAREVEEKLKKV